MERDILSFPDFFPSLKEAINFADSVYNMSKNYIVYDDESVRFYFETPLGGFKYNCISKYIYTGCSNKRYEKLTKIGFYPDRNGNYLSCHIDDLELEDLE